MRSLHRLLVVPAWLGLVSSAGAQFSAGSTPTGDRLYRIVFHAPFARVRPGMIGAPHSSEQTFDSDEVLSNGKHVTRGWREWLYRDSQGRRRTERPMFPERDMQIRLVQIVDPVSGYEYAIDVVNRVAHRFRNPPAIAAVDQPRDLISLAETVSRQSFHNEMLHPSGVTTELPKVTTEMLGERSINGLLTKGIQIVQTYRGGLFADGKPITIKTEAWVSEAMKVIVLSKRTDSNGGQAITRLLKYQPGEPDPALFQPPLNYTIVHEEGTFGLQIAYPEPPR